MPARSDLPLFIGIKNAHVISISCVHITQIAALVLGDSLVCLAQLFFVKIARVDKVREIRIAAQVESVGLVLDSKRVVFYIRKILLF